MRNSKNSGFRPWEFLVVFLVVFFLFAVALFAIDFVPESPKSAAATEVTKPIADTLAASAQTSVTSTQEFPIENPVRIVARSVGIDTPIENPGSTNIDVLDNALLKGAVHYPQSALLGENARMYIFGHQSYLPIVHNKAFKAFNGLQKLKVGDEIKVYSETAVYTYRVSSVSHVTADQGLVELGSGERTLTLTTCDSFGTKSDRNVITAEFVEKDLLSNQS